MPLIHAALQLPGLYSPFGKPEHGHGVNWDEALQGGLPDHLGSRQGCKPESTQEIGRFDSLRAEDQCTITHEIARPGTGSPGGQCLKGPVLRALALGS